MTDTAPLSRLRETLLSLDLSDPAALLGFEAQLASQNGWTLGYANQVCDEYRRFLFLTQSAGQPMCPSPDVDLAWHLHLTQTRAYQRMCTEVLGRFLHHDPSREGPLELRRHQAMYDATLRAYAAAFDMAPPAAIWPPVDQRFRRPQAAPEEEAFWQVPAALQGAARSAMAWMLMAALAGWLLVPVLAGAIGSVVGGVWFAGAYLAVLVSIVGILRAHGRIQRAAAAAAPTLDPYEVAWLAGGQDRVIGTALASLVDRGALKMKVQRAAGKITGGTCRRTLPSHGPLRLHDVERALLADLPDGNVDKDQIRQVASDRFQPIARRLEGAGLLHRAGHLPRARAIAGGLLAILLVIGFGRLWQGLSLGFPVWYLVLLLLLTAVVTAQMFAATGCPTALGARVLAELALQPELLQRVPSAGRPIARGGAGTEASGAVLTLAFAVFGTQAVMAMNQFAGINYLLGSDSDSVTGDSKSAAGCGSGCGGGCGGCGGCGG